MGSMIRVMRNGMLVALATVVIISPTSAQQTPNLLFILDASGSMWRLRALTPRRAAGDERAQLPGFVGGRLRPALHHQLRRGAAGGDGPQRASVEAESPDGVQDSPVRTAAARG